MSRLDRSTKSLRPLAISQSILSRSDGSAQFSFGDVSVLSSVTGPAEVRLREEIVDRATLEFNVSPLSSSSGGGAGPRTKSIEDSIEALFRRVIVSTSYPRSLIQITSQTVSSPSTKFSQPLSSSSSSNSTVKRRRNNVAGGGGGASEQAARINSISLALSDAAVQTNGLLVSVAIAFVPAATTTTTTTTTSARRRASASTEEEEEEEIMILDPTAIEEERATSTHVITIRFGTTTTTKSNNKGPREGRGGEIVGTDSIGQFTTNQLFEAQNLALEAGQTILGFMRRSIEVKYGVSPSSAAVPTTTTAIGQEVRGGDIPMCVAEEGDDMSDDDDDQVVI